MDERKIIGKIREPFLLSTFISIPKCATKTILKMFELGKNRDNHFDDKSEPFIINENHQRLKVLENKYDLENNYIFTFVRHPFQRIKSWFYYHKDIEPYKSSSLNEWIKNGCQTHWCKQNETDWKKENLSPLLQYNFVDGNSKIDYIGKIENFEHDCKNIISELNKLFEKNNCQKRISYKNIKINTSKKNNYFITEENNYFIIKENNDFITEENKILIYNMFRKDFDYFGYSFSD